MPCITPADTKDNFTMTALVTRHDWTQAEVLALLRQPFNDLLFNALTGHAQHDDANRLQESFLLSIKTCACPEDGKDCPRAGHYSTGLDKEKPLEVQKELDEAAAAKANCSNRLCMGAA